MNEKQQQQTLHTTLDKWITTKSHLRQSTIQAYIRYCNMIKSHFDKDTLIHHITKQDLISFLSQYNTKPCELKRYYTLLRSIFEYASFYDVITNNPFNNMKYKMFVTHKHTHHKALNEKELQEILHLLNNAKSHFRYNSKQDKVIQLCLKFGIYTALRKYNLINLEWSEVNFKDKMLVIPSHKMKNKKTFKLPLSHQALNILEYMNTIKQDNDNYVFSINLTSIAKTRTQIKKAIHAYNKSLNSNNPKSISKTAREYNIAYSTLQKYIKNEKTISLKTTDNQDSLYYILLAFFKIKHRKGTQNKLSFSFNLHSLRSTFSTMLYEKTPLHKIDFIIIEMCLSHAIGNQIITSYNFSERLNERRELMQFWANYIDSLNETRQLKKVGNMTILDINDNLSF